MTKKKKSQLSLASKADSKGDSTSSVPPSPASQSPTLGGAKQAQHQQNNPKPQGSPSASPAANNQKAKQQEPSTSALIICRNKYAKHPVPYAVVLHVPENVAFVLYLQALMISQFYNSGTGDISRPSTVHGFNSLRRSSKVSPTAIMPRLAPNRSILLCSSIWSKSGG
jgi:hypothetical protein